MAQRLFSLFLFLCLNFLVLFSCSFSLVKVSWCDLCALKNISSRKKWTMSLEIQKINNDRNLTWNYVTLLLLEIYCLLTLVTDLSSSFNLLSLSSSLSFLTSSGEFGTNHLATHLKITTTCCSERERKRERQTTFTEILKQMLHNLNRMFLNIWFYLKQKDED